MDSKFDFDTIIGAMADGLIIANPKGIIRAFNPACERIFGYAASEVLGENIELLLSHWNGSDSACLLGNINHSAREISAKKKDGSKFPVEITIAHCKLGRDAGLIFCIRDISERKAQEHYRQKEELINQHRLQLAVRGAVDGIWDWVDSRNDEVYWSPQWKALLGYADDEISGSKTMFRALLHPDDIEPCAEEVRQCLENGKPFDIEYRLKKKSGDYGWFHGRGATYKNDGITRMTGIITDIGDRKFAENIRDRLIQQLTSANEKLEQFAYVASHDLREPLRLIVIISDLIKKEYYSRLDEEGQQYIEIVRTAAKKTEAMVRDLLEYSRFDHDNVTLVEVDCNNKLEYIKEIFGEPIETTKAIIHHDPLPKIMADPLRFSRLLQNLIGNSIKYQQPGNQPRIFISALEEADFWKFAISDNGIGIQQNYLESIFAPFERLHSDQEYIGTGIGLAICRRIVESLGGRIWAESVYGYGSTFYFTIPKRTPL